MPAPAVQEIKEKIIGYLGGQACPPTPAYYLGGPQSASRSASLSQMEKDLFFDSKTGCNTAYPSDVQKALQQLEKEGKIARSRQKDEEGERWVYSLLPK